MLIRIQHETRLSYDARISESVVELRMVPRSDRHQTLRGFQLRVGPNAPIFEHVDWLGTRVHEVSIPELHDTVIIRAESAVETHPTYPKLEAVSDPVGAAADQHRMWDYLSFEGPIDDAEGLEAFVDELGLRGLESTGDAVVVVTNGLGNKLEYEKGVTSSVSSVEHVLAAGRGVCQDFAHVAIASLRRIGIPTRYTSGYLYRPGKAELETHAWCEAWVPSAGWIAFDPTNACPVGEGYVAIASGRSYADIPPNRGVYRGGAHEAISVRVETEEIDEVPQGLLTPRGGRLDAETFGSDPVHREQLDYQQEQRQQQQ